MRKGRFVDSHVEAEGIEISESDDWNGGRDIPYDFMQDLKDFLSNRIDESHKEPGESMVAREPSEDEGGIISRFGGFSIRHLLEEEDDELASRDEVMELSDEIYDCFEEIFEVEFKEDVRDEWKSRTVYDEGLVFKIGKRVKNKDFFDPMAATLTISGTGVLANSIRAWYKYDEVLNKGGDFIEAQKAMDQAMALNDEIGLGIIGLGLGYSLVNSMDTVDKNFSGKYHRSSIPVIKSLDLGGSDPKIAITPDRTTPEEAFYTGVAENLHSLQDSSNSPTYFDPILTEGMDIFAKYLVAEEMENRDVLDIDHGEKRQKILDEYVFRAYGIMKNNGGYLVRDDTFIDVGLDPEESKRMAEYVESYMARTDRTDEQLFGYSIGGAYLIMEYEKGNIEPAEVLREGLDAMPPDFQKVYDMALMENI
ncbi:MAG: hypothetical protein ABEJ36_05315 [Candidatus Nanosalina sp.]